MKHTKGPWVLDDMGDRWDLITNSDHPSGPTWIAKIISGYDGDEENARLIKCAPKLLNTLKIAVEVMKDNNIDESMAGEFEIFTDVIKEAEGE